VKTYFDKSTARKAAKSAGLDLTRLTFVKTDDGRWGWAGPQPDPETDAIDPAVMADHPVATETPDQMRARLESETISWLSDGDQITATEEIAQIGRIDVVIDPVSADLSAKVEAITAQTDAALIDKIEAEDATLDPNSTYTISFKIERKNDALACVAAHDYAKKLGFGILMIGPTGLQFVAFPNTKAAKPAKSAAATSAAPREKTSAMMEAAQRGVMPTPPDFSKPTHKSYRKKLAALVDLANNGDVAGLRAFDVEPLSTSRTALWNYRNAAVAALTANKAA